MHADDAPLLDLDFLSAEPQDEPEIRGAPWLRRGRSGLRIRDRQPELDPFLLEQPDAPVRGLSPQEARRLGLRPRGPSAGDASRWPLEPESPPSPSVEAFTLALGQLCPPKDDRTRLAKAIVRWSRHFGVDPFLLGAVVYHQSRCDPTRSDAYGIGAAALHPAMFHPGLRNGFLRYGHPDGIGGFFRDVLPVGRYRFSPRTLGKVEPNLYYAAALMRVFQQQCPAIDRPFRSLPHRHAVSHFVWGDVVRGTRPEDHILTARRRLLYYYAPQSRAPRGLFGTTALSSPLDGAPRLVIGVMGDERESGRRKHRGIDMAAAEGEPVLAMAPGIVTFAGADLRAQGFRIVDPEDLARVRHGNLGPRGLFVRVRHPEGFESLYAHLRDFRVRVGDPLRRGQEIGHVGRTGIHTSDAHLHLGLFVDGKAADPLPALQPYSIRALRTDPKLMGEHLAARRSWSGRRAARRSYKPRHR